MPINVECEDCGKKYRMREDLAGEYLPCKECGAEMFVPNHDVSDPTVSPNLTGGRGQQRSGEQRRRPQPQPSGPNKGLWIGLGVGGAAAVIACIVTLVIVFGGDDENQKGDGDVAQSNPDSAAAGGQQKTNSKTSAVAGIDNIPGIGLPANLPPGVTPRNNPAPKNNPPNNNPPKPQPQPRVPRPLPQPKARETVQLPKPQGSTKWTVEVDPTANPVAFTKTTDFRLKLPESFGGDTIVFPTTPSPFVALGNNWDDKKVREVWNFVTQQKVGAVTGIKIWGQNYRLSPNGVYLAYTISQGKGPHVINAKEPQDLGELELGANIFSMEIMDFAGNDRIIAAARNEKLKVWKLPSGDLEREVELPKNLLKETFCLTPGGRYLGVSDRSSGEISVVDLNNGQVAGIIPLPQDEKGNDMNCKDLEFSTDGTEFAGLFERSSKWRMVIWKVSDGAVSDEYSFGNISSLGGRGKTIQWFPNGQRLLVKRRALLDRQAQTVVWTLPDLGSDPMRVVDDHRILGLDKKSKPNAAATLTLPEEQIAAATDVIKSGGTAADAGLPPITKSDLSGLKSISLAESGGAWSVTADPAPKPESPLLPKPIQLKPSSGQLQQMLLTRADGAKAVVMYASPAARSTRPSRGGGGTTTPPAKTPVWLEVYDLLQGARAATLEIAFPSKLVAVSPSGRYAMMSQSPTGERVDVWNLEEQSHFVAWRPYQQLPGDDTGAIRVVGQQTGPTDRSVSGAVFLDETHVLTMNRKKTLILWELPTCKAVYEIQNASQPGISPGGKTVAVSSGQGFRFFDSLTGEPRGDLQSSGALACAAFHPDGERFAVIFQDGKGVNLVCWNIAKGEVLHEFRLPQSGRVLQWCGDQHLLLDGEKLIDVSRKMVAWKYNLSNGVRSPISPDDQLWYLSSQPGSSTVYLAAARLPEPRVAEHLEQQQVQPDYVIQPGSKVTVMINLRDPPGHTAYRSKLYKNIIDRYAQNGVTVAAGQPVEVAFEMSHRSTGETQTYHVSGQLGDVSISQEMVDCAVTIKRDGKLVWDSKSRFSNTGGFFIRVPQGQSIADHLTKSMWNSAANHFLNYSPPVYVFPKSAGEGLGQSLLSPDGVTTGL